jgi:hypothetical protein
MKSDELRALITARLSPEQMIEIIIDLYEMRDKLPPTKSYSSVSIGNLGYEIDAANRQERDTLGRISAMILDRVQRPHPIELKKVIETIDAMCAVLAEHNANSKF